MIIEDIIIGIVAFLIGVGVFIVAIGAYVLFYGLIIVGIIYVVCWFFGIPFPPHIAGI